jgi:excisionase family DNA binding protein
MRFSNSNPHALAGQPSLDSYYFHTGHAMKFLGVTRRTLYRWLDAGKIEGFQTPNRQWLFSLKEINRVRQAYGMPPLTLEQAEKFWNTY